MHHDLLNQKLKSKPSLMLTLGPFVGSLLLAAILILASNLSQIVKSQQSLVLGAASSAYENLLAAQSSLSQADLEQASNLFAQSVEEFEQVNQTLAEILKKLEPLSEDRVIAAKQLAEAGQAISTAGYFLSAGLQGLSDTAPALSSVLTLDSSRHGAIKERNLEGTNIRAILESAYAQLSWADELINQAAETLNLLKIDSLPADLGDSVNSVKQMVGDMAGGFRVLADFNALLLDLVSGYHKTYLLLFQNTAEARPTGGFLGSYGLLKLRDGQISSLLIESIYEIDGRLSQVLEPPKPFKDVGIERWFLRDANWWPDFKVSAQNISMFYEWEGKETVDGIIALTPALMEDVLSVIGPIEMPEYNVNIHSENFYETVQLLTTTQAANDPSKPKEFIADLSAAIFQKLPSLSVQQKLQIFGVLLDNITQKNILLWSRHSSTQSLIENLRLSGEMHKSDQEGDYLLITGANVGGSKTDRFMGSEVDLTTTITRDGRIKNTLKIKRTNQSPATLGNTRNLSYIRIYVPKDSKLLQSSETVETFVELDRTVYAYTSDLDSGQSHHLVLEYVLPPQAYKEHSHTLFLQKNPGQSLDRFNYSLKLANSKKIVQTIGGVGGDILSKQDGLELRLQPFQKDTFFGVVFE